MEEKRRRGVGTQGTRPLSSLKGYKLSQLPTDLIAAAVVTALTLPVSMGYAEIVGVPAVYGLYASIVATLVFALVTGTRHIVFGMDSATSAVAGTTLVSMGLVLQSSEIEEVMPLFTLLTAAFLALFWVFRAGRLVRYVPSPVMHGFVAGISLSVCISQIPTLFGTGYSGSTAFPFGMIEVFASIPNAQIASTCIALGTFAVLILCKRFAPKLPGSLVALVLATLATALFSLDAHGVNILGSFDAGLPMPKLPRMDVVNIAAVAGGAFSVAVVITIESLLCLETFAIKTGKRSSGNREVISFAIANAAAGVFGCPPCSASISRTAAAMDSRGSSQLVSVFAAIFVAAVVLVLSPALYYLPRPALAAIVFMALVGVVDYKRIASYGRHSRLEFSVFLLTALAVFAAGAIAGVAIGIALSFAVSNYRARRTGQQAMLGVAPQTDADKVSGERPNPGVPFAVFSLKGRLTFYNVDDRIDRILDRIEPDTKAVILKVSKVQSMDASATDKMVQLIELLHARGIHVKLIRKIRTTDDDYTRSELRRVLGEAKVYPNSREAIEGIARDFHDQRIEVDVPILTVVKESVSKNSKSYYGRVRFPHSGEKMHFSIDVDTSAGHSRENEAFATLNLVNEERDQLLVRYSYGTWTWNLETENTKAAVKRLRAFAETQT